MSSLTPHCSARGRVMSCASEVLVVGGPDPASFAERGMQMLHDLELRWSRFLPDSDISSINAAAGTGRPVDVHHSTRDLLMLAVHGWVMTDGRYDPTVHRSMVAMGYDRSYAHVREGVTTRPRFEPGPGCADIEIDVERCTVRLPHDVSIDPGGIGKGLAADLVVTELRERGASGVLVNMGGDVRVSGESPNDDVWVVAVEDPFDTPRDLLHVRVTDAGVAVSSRLTRTWAGPDGREVHHLVDPRTGRPIADEVASAMVLAGTAWWAEVLTKAALVEGGRLGDAEHRAAQGAVDLIDLIGEGSSGLVVTAGGHVHQSAGLAQYVVRPSLQESRR